MRAKISFYGRTGQGQFLRIQIKKGQPIKPEGVTSYYARFTQDGKRIIKPLGSEIAGAYISFTNLEDDRRNEERGIPAAVRMVAAPVTGPGTNLTFDELVEKYLAEKRHQPKRTVQAYANSLRKFQASVTVTSVHSINRDHMLKFRNDMYADKELCERSVYNNFLNLMIFLKWAKVNRDDIKKSDWPNKPERRVEIYSKEEIDAMLNTAKAEERLLVNCLLCSGGRISEIANLTYKDIDFKHNLFSFWTKENWKTKTPKSNREVPVPAWLTKTLKERMLASKGTLIFPNRDGGVNGHLIRIVQRVGKRAGIIEGRIDDHKFRSTAATRWLEAGNDPNKVRQWLGHTNLATILRYLELVNNRSAKVHDQATAAFAEFEGVGD